eukprot:gene15125-biopygen21694
MICSGCAWLGWGWSCWESDWGRVMHFLQFQTVDVLFVNNACLAALERLLRDTWPPLTSKMLWFASFWWWWWWWVEDPRCGRRGGGDYTSCQGGLETAARDQKYNHDNNITDEVTAVCSPLPIPVCGLFLQEGGILAPGVRPSQGEVPFPFQPPPIRPRPARPGRASRASAHSGSPCTWSPEMFVARSEKGRPHRRPIRESQQQ